MNAMSPQQGKQQPPSKDASLESGGWLTRLLNARLHKLLDQLDEGITHGSIEIELIDGGKRLLGGRGDGPEAKFRLNSWMAFLRVAASGSSGLYRAWEKGEWDSPAPVDLFEVLVLNRGNVAKDLRAKWLSKFAAGLRHRWHENSKAGARKNIEYHYDLGNEFYASWLDSSMSYSSAIFENLDDNIETLLDAQVRKQDAILRRIGEDSGSSLAEKKILEIGSGWGALAIRAAGYGAHVTSLTLSKSQQQWAIGRANEAELHGSVEFRLQDYRDCNGTYDAIMSVEMVEAVGQEYWPDFLDCIARNLKAGGTAALQYISIDDAAFPAYSKSVDFIQSYVFPGGLLLSESRFKALAEERGLSWQRHKDYGPHYAKTLEMWRERFDVAAENGQLSDRYDEKFVRLWRYYLMYCEGGFRGSGINVSQVTLVKD